MNDFEHERLDVYQAAIQFLALADTIAGSLPRGRSYLADQLRRAASSISRAPTASQTGRGLLLPVVAMLTAMVVKTSGSGSGSGSGSTS